MQKLAGFWRSLESVPGLAAVTVEWKALLGPEYEQVQGFFRPNGRLATSYPCTQEPDCGCYHEVIEHAPDDLVAACRCEPKRCDTFKVTRADIAFYELDRKALCADITLALQIQPDFSPVEDMWQTYLIGHYAPYAGFRFPVFLAIQIEPDEFHQVVQGLVVENDEPFILLSPTYDLYKPGCEKLLQKRAAHFLALDEILALDDEGKFTAEQTINSLCPKLQSSIESSRETIGTRPSPPLKADDWNWPGLPDSLKNLAEALPTDTTITTYDLSQRLGREPSRIISDHRSGRWKKWIEHFIGRERGLWWLK